MSPPESSGLTCQAFIRPQSSTRGELAPDVTVGAYAIIKGPVTIGSGTRIGEHCVLEGAAIIGRNCRIGPAAYVGLDPQHLRFVPDEANPTYLIVGNDVIIRESRPHPSLHQTGPGKRDENRRSLFHHGLGPCGARLRLI